MYVCAKLCVSERESFCVVVCECVIVCECAIVCECVIVCVRESVQNYADVIIR